MGTHTSPAYTKSELKDKIAEMYSEIGKHRIAVSLDFSAAEKTYIIKFEKGTHALTTHLEKKGADECMNGIKCVYLGVQIGEFLKNFKAGEKIDETAQ